jgi:histidyl-tRNA synthetase
LGVIDAIRTTFEQHGFLPLDTPAFERVETLLGKYGEDEKLIYKILKRGEAGRQGEVDLALRYDLTVPLARVMAMHPDLRLPFRRWQISPVWRADRPGRGRYREFLQCDVDIVGASGATAEAECLAVADRALRRLGFVGHRFRLNDRRILRGIAALLGALDAERSLLIAVDKLDKIGQDGVSKELHKRDFSQDQTDALWGLLEAGDQDEDTLTRLEDKLAKISDEALRKEALEGVSGLRRLSGEALALGMHAEAFTVDPTLARGLDYYTGPVFEIAHPDLSGSLGGGGRYDGLIESLGGPALPAVGISLGLERIILILQERENASTTQVATEVLVTVFDDTLRNASLKTAASMRSEGLNVDMYASEGKLRKQFKYADALGIPWLVVLGPDEAEKQTVTLKHLVSGDQFNLTLEQACEHVRKARALPSDEPTG